HPLGFFWGDCSRSNLLFRRDAGALSAYMVDAETGELHERLSDGQRRHDLDIAEENLIGELLDLAAEVGEEADEPFELGEEVRRRYERLWAELTDEEVFGPDESYRVEERLRRLNELGFDAEEGKVAAAELFHELLEHRWFLSEKEGKDVGMKAATQSYVDDVLRAAPEEKAALLAEDYVPPVPPDET